MDERKQNVNGTLFSINELIDLYLDWFNNFITISAFASYYQLTEDTASIVIKEGREMHERKVFKGFNNE